MLGSGHPVFTVLGDTARMTTTRIASVAATIASVLALVAAVSAATALPPVTDEVFVVEVWRVVGLATWAVLFGVLARRPGLVVLWVVALVSKLALAAVGVVGVLAAQEMPGAADLVLWDGVLSVVLATGTVAAVRARPPERP